MNKNRADLRLMLVTDAAMSGRRGLQQTVLAAIAGGVTIVQLRDKTLPDEVLADQARALKARLAPLGIPLIVNDRVEVARAALGKGALIGLSITAAEQVRDVDANVVDYVGLGPVFATATKPDADPPIGLDGLRAIRARLALPVVAIGGIDVGNAGAVAAAGADGIAVISAICAAPDPAAAAAALHAAMAAGGRA
jgi:thiamine-phosphate pyrophosphorylase